MPDPAPARWFPPPHAGASFGVMNPRKGSGDLGTRSHPPGAGKSDSPACRAARRGRVRQVENQRHFYEQFELSCSSAPPSTGSSSGWADAPTTRTEDRGPAGRHRALRGARRAAAEARLNSRAGRAPARGRASRRHRGPGETADLPTLSDSQTSEGNDGTGRSGVLPGVPNARRGPAQGEDPARSRFADEVQVVDVEELDAEGAGCEPPPWPPRPSPVVMVFRSLLTSSITGDPDFVPNTS